MRRTKGAECKSQTAGLCYKRELNCMQLPVLIFKKKHTAIVCVIPSIKSEFLIIVDLSIMQVITIILLYAGLT